MLKIWNLCSSHLLYVHVMSCQPKSDSAFMIYLQHKQDL